MGEEATPVATWTRSAVGSRAIAGMRKMQTKGLWSPYPGAFYTRRADPDPDLLLIEAIVAWLPKDLAHRVLAWARCKAQGESFRDLCRESGWQRGEVPAALDRVARKLNTLRP